MHVKFLLAGIAASIFANLFSPATAAAAGTRLAEEVRFLRRPASEQSAASLVLDRHEYTRADADAQGFVLVPSTKTPAASVKIDLSLIRGNETIARQSLASPTEQMVAFLVPLGNLRDGEYVLTATVNDGNRTSKADWTFKNVAGAPAAEFKDRGRVRLTLPSRDYLTDTAWPVRTGVPFPKGVLADPARVRLLADGREVPCQVDVRARWSPRGSIRWLGLTFVAEFGGGKCPAYELEYGIAPSAKPMKPVVTQEDADTVTVTTGALRFAIRKKNYDGVHAAWLDANGDGKFATNEQVVAATPEAAPYVVDRSGAVYRSSRDRTVKVEVESTGPVQSVVRVEGWFEAESGTRLGKYITYYEAFAGQPLVFVNNAVIMTHNTRENALKDVAFPVAVRGGNFAIGLDGKAIGGKRDGRTQVTQESWNQVATQMGTAKSRGTKVAGWADAGDDTLGVTLAAQYVWQRFPKAFSVDAGRLVFHSWPANLGDTFSREEELKDNRDYLFLSAHEGPEMNLNLAPEYVEKFKRTVPKTDREVWRILDNPNGTNGQGVALNDLFVLRFRSSATNPKEAEGLVRLLEEDPHAATDPDWIGGSHVFGPMVGVDRQNYPELENYMGRLMLSMVSWHLKDNDEYGVWNFGDVHSTWDWTKKQAASLHRVWLNAHYGQTDSIWELYGHYGDAKLLDWARVNNHHTVNVDMVNYADPQKPIPNVFDEQGKLFHRTGAVYHCKGLLHWGGDAAFSRHYCYASGLLYSWFMTGNRRSRDVARMFQDGVIADSPGGTKGRDGQTAMGEAVEYYQNWWDPRMLELIKRQIDVLSTEPPGKQHALYWNVMSFPRYYDLTRDPKMLQWLIDDPVFRTKDESYFLSAYLYLVTGDKKYFDEMRNLYVHVRNQYNNPASTYDGMDDMRWVDRIQQLRQYFVMQAALKKAGRPIERPANDGNIPIYNGAHIRVMNKATPITIGATKEGGRALLLSIDPAQRSKIQVVGPDEKPVALVDQPVAGKPGLVVPSHAADGVYAISIPADLYKAPIVTNAEEFFYLKKGKTYTLCGDGTRAGGQISPGSQFNITPLKPGVPLSLSIKAPKYPVCYELFGPDGKELLSKTRGFGETDKIAVPPTGGPYTLLVTRISSVIPDQDMKAVPYRKR